MYPYVKSNSGTSVSAGVCADARREGEQSAPGGPGGQRARAEDGRVRRAPARGQQHQQVRSLLCSHCFSLRRSSRCVALEAMTCPRPRPRSFLFLWQILRLLLLGSLLCASEQTIEYSQSTAGNTRANISGRSFVSKRKCQFRAKDSTHMRAYYHILVQ